MTTREAPEPPPGEPKATPPGAARRKAYLWGLSAETRAALLLRLKGYHILERRFRVPAGEIDLIARRGRVLVFIEVKARVSLDAAIEAVTPRAIERIGRAANAFVSRHPAYRTFDQRFDLIAVMPRRFPVHLPHAFEPDWRPGAERQRRR
jgi:putative endonuclease